MKRSKPTESRFLYDAAKSVLCGCGLTFRTPEALWKHHVAEADNNDARGAGAADYLYDNHTSSRPGIHRRSHPSKEQAMTRLLKPRAGKRKEQSVESMIRKLCAHGTVALGDGLRGQWWVSAFGQRGKQRYFPTLRSALKAALREVEGG